MTHSNRVVGGLPSTRRIANAISMGHYQRDLGLAEQLRHGDLDWRKFLRATALLDPSAIELRS